MGRAPSRSWSTAHGWSVIEAGLRCLQGKGVVNLAVPQGGRGSRSSHRPRVVRSFRCRRRRPWPFDEKGQAGERSKRQRSRSCERAYRLLVDVVGFQARGHHLRLERARPSRRGIEEHKRLCEGVSSRPLPLIKERCPGSKTSRRHLESLVLLPGQQRSCARGHALRVPLPRDQRRGSTWAIVNAGQLVLYQDIDPELARGQGRGTSSSTGGRDANRASRRDRRTVRRAEGARAAERDLSWREGPVEERLSTCARARDHRLHRGRRRRRRPPAVRAARST